MCKCVKPINPIRPIKPIKPIIMKKLLLIVGVAVAVLAVACNKEKSCRCSVIGKQQVRVINIKHGSCEKLHTAGYFDALDTLHTDSILCTDFPFDADSMIVER